MNISLREGDDNARFIKGLVERRVHLIHHPARLDKVFNPAAYFEFESGIAKNEAQAISRHSTVSIT
jgi:hypothetical protein